MFYPTGEFRTWSEKYKIHQFKIVMYSTSRAPPLVELMADIFKEQNVKHQLDYYIISSKLDQKDDEVPREVDEWQLGLPNEKFRYQYIKGICTKKIHIRERIKRYMTKNGHKVFIFGELEKPYSLRWAINLTENPNEILRNLGVVPDKFRHLIEGP